jgi:hypothetical protein
MIINLLIPYKYIDYQKMENITKTRMSLGFI